MNRVAHGIAGLAVLATALLASASRADVDGSMDAAARALVDAGEVALAAGDVEGAQSAFERAAANRHDAAIEMALVRTDMQAGRYRSALALAAHSAGIHRDYPDAAALHAWLLFAGGQRDVASQLLESALAASPGRPALRAVRTLVAEDWPAPDAALLDPPLRLAPYAAPGLPETTLLSGATLIDGGRRALAPLAAGSVPPGARVWVRNGTGLAVTATLERFLRAGELQLAILRLETPLPWPAELIIADRSPFAGSPGYSIQYVSTAPVRPTWPVLSVGFFGRHAAEDSLPSLGIPAPGGALGGPVFDGSGRLAGIAALVAGSVMFVPLDALEPPLGDELPRPDVAATAARRAIDSVYEQSLLLSLQVLH